MDAFRGWRPCTALWPVTNVQHRHTITRKNQSYSLNHNGLNEWQRMKIVVLNNESSRFSFCDLFESVMPKFKSLSQRNPRPVMAWVDEDGNLEEQPTEESFITITEAILHINDFLWEIYGWRCQARKSCLTSYEFFLAHLQQKEKVKSVQIPSFVSNLMTDVKMNIWWMLQRLRRWCIISSQAGQRTNDCMLTLCLCQVFDVPFQ